MPEIKKEVYEIEAGKYGFRIYINDIPIIIQEFKPEVEGWQPMSEEEANMEADKMLASIQIPPSPATYEGEIAFSSGLKAGLALTAERELTQEEMNEIESKLGTKMRMKPR